jgi:hypothetical protein
MSNYQEAKSLLRSHAEYVSVLLRGDKPGIRQSINDYADSVGRDYKLTEYQKNLLANYACKLHPKNKAQRRSESYHASLLYGIDNQ